MSIEAVHQWILALSENYSVNPYIFASIYVGAIPFFTVSVAWIIRNKRRGKPLALPILSTGLCLSSAYIYLLIAGENVSWWVYGIIATLLAYGIFTTFQKVSRSTKTREDEI